MYQSCNLSDRIVLKYNRVEFKIDVVYLHKNCRLRQFLSIGYKHIGLSEIDYIYTFIA